MYEIFYDDGKLTPVNTRTYLHASTARRDAQSAADASGHAVSVRTGGRIGGKTRYRIEPNGKTKPPPGVQVARRDKCVAGSGVTCWCPFCRSQRS